MINYQRINDIQSTQLVEEYEKLFACQQTSNVPHLLHLANQGCDGNLLELSQRINNLFKSVSAHLPALSADNDYLQSKYHVCHLNMLPQLRRLKKQLRQLDTSKAPGPGSVPSWVLNEFS